MKGLISIIVAAVLLCTVFTACGKKDDMREEITSAEDKITTVLEEASRDVSEFADDMTGAGNVTDQTGEGILEEAITDISDMLEGNKDDETTKAE